MSKKQLIIRLILFTLLACVLPFVFIAWRYQIFKVSKVSFTGWGLLGFIIVLVFTLYIARAMNKIKKWSMFKQCFLGALKILVPLIACYVFLTSIKTSIDLFLQVLIVVVICEAIAIPINPLPKWQFDNNIDLLDSIINKSKEGDK